MPIFRAGELDIISHSAEQTLRLGARLGKLLQSGDVICLSGDLGAGKTVFAAGIGRGWGISEPLTSPTFGLIHEHTRSKNGQRLYHMDCYRLSSPDEVEMLGLEDILDRNELLVLEWPEHIESALPHERLWVELRILEPTRRNFIFEATGARYEDLLARYREETFGI